MDGNCKKVYHGRKRYGKGNKEGRGACGAAGKKAQTGHADDRQRHETEAWSLTNRRAPAILWAI